MKTGPAILSLKILYHQRWRTNVPFHSIKKLCVIPCYSKSFKWTRSNQSTGRMYTIKSYKNFWKDFVVEWNLTLPKDRASDISWKKKTQISRDFQRQIRRKIRRFRGIFAGKKSKFAQQSADFRRFSREKSQNSQKNQPISWDFSGKKSIFEGFSEANF